MCETVARCSFYQGDVIDNIWVVEKMLGEGTFGQVYKVIDNQKQTKKALKILKLWEMLPQDRPNYIKRFDREFKIGNIESEYIARSLVRGFVNGNPYVVMDYYSGGDLFSNLQNAKSIDLISIGTQILWGLKDLHENGIIHRDLKPENVLLKDLNHAVLTDFGIAGDQNNRITRRGWNGVPKEFFGTIAYMPPEQLNPRRGMQAIVLPTTDIFSFGVMMYQCITGKLPFGELRCEADVTQYVIRGKENNWDRDLLKQLAPEWYNVIDGCLIPDYKQRLQNIDSVLTKMPITKNRVVAVKHSQTKFNNNISKGVALKIMQGEDIHRVYSLPSLFIDSIPIIYLGRHTSDVWNHIQIKETESSFISRKHCTIEYMQDSNQWLLRDGQSRCECAIGLKFQAFFPCKLCTALCVDNSLGKLNWKSSLNGTYVNSQKINSQGIIIKPGDIITLGDTKFRVEGI